MFSGQVYTCMTYFVSYESGMAPIALFGIFHDIFFYVRGHFLVIFFIVFLLSFALVNFELQHEEREDCEPTEADTRRQPFQDIQGYQTILEKHGTWV